MNRNMEAITWSLHARGITPTARVLLTELCGYVNSSRDDYAVWPSHRLLAENVEISISGVKRHLKELVDAGYLTVRPGVRKDGGRSSNVYDVAVSSAHRLPKGRIVQTKAPPVQDDLSPPVQDELGSPVTGERGWQATVDLCNEPLESRTSERRNNPSLPSEETPPGDLFDSNLPVVIDAKPSIIEYVDAEWKKLVAEYPRTVGIRVWNDSRRKGVAKRAQEGVRAWEGAVNAYQIWDMIFAAIRGDRWLRGEAEPSRDYPTAFALEIDTMLRPKFFARTLEKAATNELDNIRTSDPCTGRQFGPGEQAARAAIQRIRAAQQPRG